MNDKIISQEVIETFLNGGDIEEYIIGVEYDYPSNKIFKIIQDPVRGKLIKEDKLTPFLWVSDISDLNFYNNSKTSQKKKMNEFGILIEKLDTHDNQRLINGQKYLVKSLKGYRQLIEFFKNGGIDPWGEKYKKYFTILTPVEQFLIQKKKRLFKGIDDYSDIHRLVFDIETTGLNPETDKIILIGVKDNRGFQKTINAFGLDGEKNCIIEFFDIIRKINPSIIAAFNSASFDFPFILKRASVLNLNLTKHTQIYTLDGLKTKNGMLKLASEVEPYTQFILWGFNILDISHAVRRAQAINSEIKSWGLKYITKYLGKEKSNRVYVDGAFISTIYEDNVDYYVNPKTGNYKRIGDTGTQDLLTKYPNKFEVWSGEKIVEQYLDDDLFETMVVDDSFSQSSFLLSKLVPTTYERVSTMGTATLWKLIMLAWSYENNLAIPEKAERRSITGGLSRLLKVGYSKNIVKFDYSSLYPSIQLVYDVFPECDVMNVQRSLLKYFRDVRIKYKTLTSVYENTDPELSEMYDRKQLPIKIFINAYFGSLSAPLVFPWGDMNKGEMITCTGRQLLRMMVHFFQNKNYIPLVMDTDGVNFSYPDDIDTHTYVGKGKNDMVEKDKVYTGIVADLAEFNDIFMRNEMGLGIDYLASSCINVSRKNYIIKMTKKGKEIVKLTGNTIKSKKLQQYVVEFLDEGLTYLLNGDGLSFVELYYDYVLKIYNKEIPLSKIANKSRVKQSLADYRKYIQKTTKSGNLMARQAHMELVMTNEYLPTLGETIYYVNNGTKKSHGDVQKDPKTGNININSYMITEKEMRDNPDMLGEYNVSRYLTNFNKRIEPLLVVFSLEIRDDIIIENPKDRGFFTKQQCDLVYGFPLKEGGQDSFDDVMTLSDTEVSFWSKSKVDPYYMYLDDSIQHADQQWVKFNRNAISFVDFTLEKTTVKNHRGDDIINTNGNDFSVVDFFNVED